MFGKLLSISNTLAETRTRNRLKATNFRSGLADSAWVLHGVVRAMKPEVCVEIGSARGCSTCHIALALQENRRGRLHAIDPHMATQWNDAGAASTLEVLKGNLRRLKLDEFVDIIRKTSAEAARDWRFPIDVLFIDGDHSYEGVKHDWELFRRFLRPFGIVVFHDTIWNLQPQSSPHARPDMGVPRFVDELRTAGYPVITLPGDYGVSLVQAVPGGVPLLHA